MSSSDKTITLTEKELRAIIKESVHETLLSFGINVEKPIEVQDDFKFLRNWRNSSEAVNRKAKQTIVGLFITGLVGAVWYFITHSPK